MRERLLPRLFATRRLPDTSPARCACAGACSALQPASNAAAIAPRNQRGELEGGLPATRLAAVLLIEPCFERSEVFDQRLAAHFAAPGEGLQRVGPGSARPHLEHGVELLAHGL